MKYFLLENFSIFIEAIVNIFTLILLFRFLIHIFKTQKNIAFAMLITYWSGRQDRKNCFYLFIKLLIYNIFIYNNSCPFITIYEKITSNCCPRILDISLVEL